MKSYLQEIDTKLFFLVNHHLGNRLLDPFFSAISDHIFWAILLLLALVWGLVRAKESTLSFFWRIAISVSLTDWVAFRYLKPFFGRIRPCYEFDLLVRLAENRCGGELSFPSNHAANGFAFLAVAFWGRNRSHFCKIGWRPLLFVVSLVALSRVYLGVHYPGDVFFGACFGFTFSFLVLMLLDKFSSWFSKSQIARKAKEVLRFP